MLDILKAVFYEPIYNGFVFFLSVTPGADVGLSIILVTIAVRFILLPFSHKHVSSQAQIKKIEPEVSEIRNKYTDRQEQAKRIMELYQKHGINPFSSCLFVLLQIPVIFSLYWVFFKGLPDLNPEILYSFILLPETLNMHFLGVFDMVGKSVFLAFLAGISQYYQINLSVPLKPKPTDGEPLSFRDEFQRNMGFQLRYMLPVLVFFVSYTISAAVALYWFTSNLFSIAHELIVKRKASAIMAANTEPETNSEDRQKSRSQS